VIRVEPEDSLAQPVIPAKRPGFRLRRLDQVLDDGRRNVVAVKRRVERRAIAARLRVEPVALQNAVVQRRIRIDAGFEQLVVFDERRRAIALMPITPPVFASALICSSSMARGWRLYFLQFEWLQTTGPWAASRT